MKQKYEITDERHRDNPRLRRIRALIDIPRHGVRAGDLGGWIEYERNLLQRSDSWVGGAAQVYGSAQVFGSALVYGSARVGGDTWTHSPLVISGTAHTICTYSRTKLAIGCEVHTVDHWLRHYDDIGRSNGYTESQIAEYRVFIQLAASWLGLPMEVE